MDFNTTLFRKAFSDHGMDASVPCGDGILFLSTSSGHRCSLEPAEADSFSIAAFSADGERNRIGIASGLAALREFLDAAAADGLFSRKSSERDGPPQISGFSGATERERSVMARTQQDRYRKSLSALWGDRCAVTGEGFAPLLRASHAKPWAQSTDAERVDPSNGLLLRADFDALFDGGWISFGFAGECVISEQTPSVVVENLHLRKTRLRSIPTAEQSAYLQWHRENILKK